MWSDSEAPYVGKHYSLGRTLNSPQSVQRPHPRSDRRQRRAKDTADGAQYAQACNLFPGPELERKSMCYAGIAKTSAGTTTTSKKTVIASLDPGANGENVDAILTQLQELRRSASPTPHRDEGRLVAGRVHGVQRADHSRGRKALNRNRHRISRSSPPDNRTLWTRTP